jgi:LemA protein
MNPVMIAVIAVGGFFLFLVLIFVVLYNSLVGKKNQVENAFAGMDAQLKKRYDLIPNLVAAVQKYMNHEKSTLEELTTLRTKALSGNLSSNERVDIDNKISKVLGGVMVAVENYPNLKASDNFVQLQGSLNEVEEQISASRRAFNAAVTSYNNGIEMFPTNIVASMMGYDRKQVFEISEAERQNVNVGALFNQS